MDDRIKMTESDKRRILRSMRMNLRMYYDVETWIARERVIGDRIFRLHKNRMGDMCMDWVRIAQPVKNNRVSLRTIADTMNNHTE